MRPRPGVDFPMRNGIFRSQAYRWIQDATNSEVPGLLERERGCLLAPAGETLVYQRRNPIAIWIALPGTRVRYSNAG